VCAVKLLQKHNFRNKMVHRQIAQANRLLSARFDFIRHAEGAANDKDTTFFPGFCGSSDSL